jgi:hypothetical protein
MSDSRIGGQLAGWMESCRVDGRNPWDFNQLHIYISKLFLRAFKTCTPSVISFQARGPAGDLPHTVGCRCEATSEAYNLDKFLIPAPGRSRRAKQASAGPSCRCTQAKPSRDGGARQRLTCVGAPGRVRGARMRAVRRIPRGCVSGVQTHRPCSPHAGPRVPWARGPWACGPWVSRTHTLSQPAACMAPCRAAAKPLRPADADADAATQALGQQVASAAAADGRGHALRDSLAAGLQHP